MDGSSQFGRNCRSQKFGNVGFRQVILAIVFVTLLLIKELESSGGFSTMREGQDDEVPDDDMDDRTIEGKRQNYNAAKGLLAGQFSLSILISKPYRFLPAAKKRLSQEQHINFNASQKILARGYYFEEHTVETEDGYLLKLFRMQNPNCTGNTNRAPILFMHGVLDSADTWLVLSGQDGAPFQAANEGYDVWLGVLFKRLTFYVCLSVLPKYNQNIDLFIALPPSAFLTQSSSPLALLKPYAKLYNSVLIDGPFLTSEINHLISKITIPLCPFNFSIGALQNESICSALVYLGQGISKKDTNGTILQRVFGHFPSTTSKKLIAHFLQLVGEEQFSQFDYGSPLENFKRYGQTFPPSYNLYNVDVASVSYYGQRDLLIDHKDSEENLRQLGTLNVKFNVLVMDYSHLDFVWGNTAAVGITSRILRALESFYNPPPAKEPEFYDYETGNDISDYDTEMPNVRSCTCSCNGDKCYEDYKDPKNQRYHRLSGGISNDYDFRRPDV